MACAVRARLGGRRSSERRLLGRCPYPVTAAPPPRLRRAPATLLRAAALARAWWRLVLVRVMDQQRLDQRQQLAISASALTFTW